MPRRKKPRLSDLPHPLGWVVTYETKVNGRLLTPGTEVRLKNRRGRYRFKHLVTTPAGKTWMDFIGGKNGYTSWVSVRVSDVRTVHRIKRTRASLA